MASDRLAPVTYLFGATASEQGQGASPSEPAPTSPTDADGWYTEPGERPADIVDADRAQQRSRRVQPSSDIDTPSDLHSAPERSDLSHLPNFIENPDVPAVTIPAAKGESKAERRASNVSLNALARKGMSSREMEKLLERRELEPELIESEIARLEGAGLLDDSTLAENLVRTLHERKGLGRSAISAELRRRQLDDSAISVAMESIDADDELERAIEVATKRAGQLQSYDAETAKRRLGAYLQRRGYGGSVLSAAMNAALEGRRGGSGVRFE